MLSDYDLSRNDSAIFGFGFCWKPREVLACLAEVIQGQQMTLWKMVQAPEWSANYTWNLWRKSIEDVDFFTFVCACVCVPKCIWDHVCVTACKWKSQKTTWGRQFSSSFMVVSETELVFLCSVVSGITHWATWLA